MGFWSFPRLPRAVSSGKDGASAAPAPARGVQFRLAYEANFGFAWHALRRLGVAEKDLLDAVQDVFLVVYRKLPDFENASDLAPWLYAICRRVASDYRRSAIVRREVVSDPSELGMREARGSFGDASDYLQRAQIARAALDQLAPAQREVFILFELQQLSGEEISSRLSVPVGTVRSRLRLAREAFRRHVQSLVGAPKKEVG
jgi:RNA polymerase sigma-70 factor (ECF subfamily)